jgi:hypothetical protein
MVETLAEARTLPLYLPLGEHVRKSFLFILVAAAFAVPSFATTYAGSDTACFYGIFSSTCTLESSETSIGATGPLLTYTPTSSFSISGPGEVDLGTFAVNGSFANGELGTFDLAIDFTSPGGGSQSYTASTFGTVFFDNGFAEITFDAPTTQEYSYPGGSFDVSLPGGPIFIGVGDSSTLYATITAGTTATPEPSSIGLIGTLMLVGVVLYGRRRKAQTATI